MRAAEQLGGDIVRVVDTETASLAVALLAEAIDRRLERGTTDETVEALVERFKDENRVVFTVDTLEYLQKGGRIGKAQALAGSLLHVKPILSVRDGVIEPVGRVRGRQKAVAEFAKLFEADERGSRRAPGCDRPRERAGVDRDPDRHGAGDPAERRGSSSSRRSARSSGPTPAPAPSASSGSRTEPRPRLRPGLLLDSQGCLARRERPGGSAGFGGLDPPEPWPPSRAVPRPETLERAGRDPPGRRPRRPAQARPAGDRDRGRPARAPSAPVRDRRGGADDRDALRRGRGGARRRRPPRVGSASRPAPHPDRARRRRDRRDPRDVVQPALARAAAHARHARPHAREAEPVRLPGVELRPR